MPELSAVDLSRCRRLSECALGSPCALALASSADSPVFTDGDFGPAFDLDCLLKRADIDGGGEVLRFTSKSGTTYALQTVEFDDVDERHWLILRIPGHDHRAEAVPRLMNELVELIRDEYASHELLFNLSEELAVRYEELNLIYGFDGLTRRDHDATTEQSILRLVKSCRDYLPIDMVGVIVPSEGLHLFEASEQLAKVSAKGILHQLRGSRFLRMKACPETVVVNHDETEELTETFTALPVKTIVVPLRAAAGHVVGMLVFANRMTCRDFANSDRKLAEVVGSEISRVLQADRDPLTGLYNRKAFERRLEAMIDDAHESGAEHLLLYMDLDQFKLINDSAGHVAGDQLLAYGSTVLQQSAMPEWFIARLGGDEFAMLVANVSMDKGRKIAEAVRRRVVETRFTWRGRVFQTTASLGVFQITDKTGSPAEALAAVDVACQLAKDSGRNQVRCYEPDNGRLVTYHEQIRQASNLSEALQNDRFILYGQAIAPLQRNGAPHHYEILVRLQSPEGELVPPALFIPAAERYGVITAVDRWVVSNGIRIMKRLDAAGNAPRISCSINLSGASIGDPEFLGFIANAILESRIDPTRITFEVTETAAISNFTTALNFMETIKEIGSSFALDDFGVGTSSFGYLRSLPVDYVKIDGSFVKSITTSDLDFALVRSISEVGHIMGLKTVAEFVEDEPTRELLRDTGIDYAQGYGIDRPAPLIDKFQR